MKKNDFAEWAILGVLGGLVILSLVIPQFFREERAPRLLSVSVLFRDGDSWSVGRQGMEQAADELDAELRFLTPSTPGDAGEQRELMLREIDGGADALVLVPADPAQIHEALLQRPGSCPVVAIESPVDGGTAVVAPDNALLGRQLAQALLEDWDGGEVVLLDSACPGTGAAVRLEAAREVLDEAGVSCQRMTALPDGWVTKRWIMAFEPSATRQAAEKKEAEGQEYALYGVGCSTAITAQLEKGNIEAVAAWSDYALGYLAVQQAVQAVQQQRQVPEPLPFSIVRGDEIYGPENQKLLFPVMSSSGR